MARQGVHFELIGLTGLAQDIDAIRDDVRLRLEDAVDDTAHQVQVGAKTRVPLDKGDLARAIQIGGRGLRKIVGIRDDSVPSRGGKNSAHLNPWVYVLWVEFGLKHRKMAAQPFMGPAADAATPDHQHRIEQALASAVGS